MISISAIFEVRLEKVLKFTILTLSRLLSFLSLTLDQSIGCISAILAPQVMIVSVSSISS